MMPFILLVILLSGYFAGGSTPTLIKFAPELCGMAAAAVVVIYAVRHGFAKIRFVYWLLIVMIALHLLFGIIANEVQPGTVIIGGRMYLRTIPFFLLAIALTPSESALRKQFFVILGIALLQFPVAVYQKMSNYQRALSEGYVTTTGDWVTGTLGQSGFLSVFLICFATVIVALYARKNIGLGLGAILLLLVLAPTTINETKATFLLAPVAIAIPMLVADEKNRLKNSLKTFLFLGTFIAIFIPIYDYFVIPRWGYGLIDFFMMEGRLEGYLAKGAEVGTTEKAGRFDSIGIAFDVLTRDISSTAFGLGLGSVTESGIGPQYQGRYYDLYGGFAGTTYARLFWEIGFLGAALVLALLYLVWGDARRLYKQQNYYGILGLAYLAIAPLMLMIMLYGNLLQSPAISVCFWYYCGVVAAASQRQESASAAPQAEVAADDGARALSRSIEGQARGRSSRTITRSAIGAHRTTNMPR